MLRDWLEPGTVTRVVPSSVFAGKYLVCVREQAVVASLADLRQLQAALDEMLAVLPLPTFEEFDSKVDLSTLDGE